MVQGMRFREAGVAFHDRWLIHRLTGLSSSNCSATVRKRVCPVMSWLDLWHGKPLAPPGNSARSTLGTAIFGAWIQQPDGMRLRTGMCGVVPLQDSLPVSAAGCGTAWKPGCRECGQRAVPGSAQESGHCLRNNLQQLPRNPMEDDRPPVCRKPGKPAQAITRRRLRSRRILSRP